MSHTPSGLEYLIEQLPYLLPGMIVALVGMVVAAFNLRRYPKPAWLALFACTTMFALDIGIPFIRTWMFERQLQSGDWYTRFYVLTSGIHAAAVGLLIWAAFADRKQVYPPGFFESGGRDDQLRRER